MEFRIPHISVQEKRMPAAALASIAWLAMRRKERETLSFGCWSSVQHFYLLDYVGVWRIF